MHIWALCCTIDVFCSTLFRAALHTTPSLPAFCSVANAPSPQWELESWWNEMRPLKQSCFSRFAFIFLYYIICSLCFWYTLNVSWQQGVQSMSLRWTRGCGRLPKNVLPWFPCAAAPPLQVEFLLELDAAVNCEGRPLSSAFENSNHPYILTSVHTLHIHYIALRCITLHYITYYTHTYIIIRIIIQYHTYIFIVELRTPAMPYGLF